MSSNDQLGRVQLEDVLLGQQRDRNDPAVARLPPGPYVIRVEPIDDADPESFFSTEIDSDFRVTYAPRMVVAPHGGSSPSMGST